jgi:hypothetical protein
MAPEFRQALSDRLTLEYLFADVPVAFRRTPHGIELLTAGAAEIAAWRGRAGAEERVGVIYGVG